MSWAVLWMSDDGERITRHNCGNDLNEALRVYGMASRAGKKNTTLYCGNCGFPPPEKFRREKWECLNPEDPKSKQKHVRVLYIMRAANLKGIFWCPHCREFRKFGHQTLYYVEGRYARHPNKRGMLACPMCGISHRDYHVRRWNPTAEKFFASETRRKRGSRKA